MREREREKEREQRDRERTEKKRGGEQLRLSVHWWFLRHKKDKKYEKEYTLK
jgi:hypothetical protein